MIAEEEEGGGEVLCRSSPSSSWDDDNKQQQHKSRTRGTEAEAALLLSEFVALTCACCPYSLLPVYQ